MLGGIVEKFSHPTGQGVTTNREGVARTCSTLLLPQNLLIYIESVYNPPHVEFIFCVAKYFDFLIPKDSQQLAITNPIKRLSSAVLSM
jgi:hypothetical protein